MNNDDLYLGAVPPVEVNATNCKMVNVNVQIIVEQRPHDTLRRLADAIEARISGRITETGE
jgi:hypothetical protein